MKIAYFTDTFVPDINGVVTSILNSSERLAKKGHQIYIFAPKPKDKSSIILGKNITIYYYPRLKLTKYPDFQFAVPNFDLAMKIRRIRPDVIHIHTPAFMGGMALMLAKLFNILTISTYHTFLPDFLEFAPFPKKISTSKAAHRLTWAFTRRFYNRCDIVTTPSIAMKQELEKHGIKRPVVFLSNGVDLNKFRPQDCKKSGNTILHVGRISYEKNIDVLIKAFSLLKNKKSKLLIAGKGPAFDDLKKLVHSLNLFDRVIFLGPIKHDDLPKLYCTGDLFATASTVETEGIVILEAIACGLPIVGVNALALPYIIEHGKSGFLAQPGDEVQIAQFMQKMLDDKKLRETVSASGLKNIKKYSLDSVIADVEKIYAMNKKTAKARFLLR